MLGTIYIQHGKDYKLSLSLSVRMSVCTITVAFLDRFSPKVTQRQQPPKVKIACGGQHRTTYSPILPSKTAILGQKVLKIHAKLNMPIFALNVRESPEFPPLAQFSDVYEKTSNLFFPVTVYTHSL